MKLPVMQKEYPNAGIKDIRKAERALGRKFPQEYVDYLQKQNGGRFREYTAFDVMIENEAVSVIIDRWYPIKTFEYEDVYHIVYENGLLSEDIPSDFISIGVTPGGDEICLGTSGLTKGNIYFWMHEKDEGENFVFIAFNLSTFIEKLYPFETT
jgi:hypothetical protein